MTRQIMSNSQEPTIFSKLYEYVCLSSTGRLLSSIIPTLY